MSAALNPEQINPVHSLDPRTLPPAMRVAQSSDRGERLMHNGQTTFTFELVGASYPGYALQRVSEPCETIGFPACHPWDGQDEIREFAVNGIRFSLPRPELVMTGDQPFIEIKSIAVDGLPLSLVELASGMGA